MRLGLQLVFQSFGDPGDGRAGQVVGDEVRLAVLEQRREINRELDVAACSRRPVIPIGDAARRLRASAAEVLPVRHGAGVLS